MGQVDTTVWKSSPSRRTAFSHPDLSLPDVTYWGSMCSSLIGTESEGELWGTSKNMSPLSLVLACLFPPSALPAMVTPDSIFNLSYCSAWLGFCHILTIVQSCMASGFSVECFFLSHLFFTYVSWFSLIQALSPFCFCYQIQPGFDWNVMFSKLPEFYSPNVSRDIYVIVKFLS